MLGHVWFSATLWTRPPGSSAFEMSTQEYWSRLPFPSAGDPPIPGGIKPVILVSPALAGRFFYHCTTREAPRQPQILEQLELEGPNPRWLLHSSVCGRRWTQLGLSIGAPSCFFSSVVVSDSVTSDMGAQENGLFWPGLRTQMVSHPPHSTGWSNYSLSRFKMGT